MGELTGISWTDHTFNPWTGCLRVSPGCDHCYAAQLAKRNTSTFGSWEPGAERKRTSVANWRQPIKWNRDAEKAAKRAKVFCASMADVFDNQAPDEWRVDLWALIRATPWLQWQLLTKRPQNIAKMLPPDWGHGFHNVWLGTTAENRAEADRRIPHLLAVPAVIRFLSCEPLLGQIDLTETKSKTDEGGDWRDVLECGDLGNLNSIDWVIAGGESGPGARSMHPDWARSLRDQCAAAGVPYFLKQWGEHIPCITDDHGDGLRCFPAGAESPAFDNRRARHPIVQIDGQEYWRVGKNLAGDLLDGRQHHEFPA